VRVLLPCRGRGHTVFTRREEVLYKLKVGKRKNTTSLGKKRR